MDLLADRADLHGAGDRLHRRLGQPNQNISNYTLFEIAYAALTRSTTRTTRRRSWRAVQVKLPEAVAGPVDYTSTNTKTNPAPGVAITPPVGHPVAEGHQVPA